MNGSRNQNICVIVYQHIKEIEIVRVPVETTRAKTGELVLNRLTEDLLVSVGIKLILVFL